jgi:periplasmic protein TonB
MVPAPGSEERSVSLTLNACLLEGDSEVERRARRGKQRAILFSIVLQVLIVAALLLIPLLGKSESIIGRVFTPTVPYAPVGHPRQPVAERHTDAQQALCHFCQPPRIPTGIVTHDPTPPPSSSDEPTGPVIPGAEPHEGIPGGEIAVQTHIAPAPPRQETIAPTTRQRVSAGVQEAMLIHRVEPSYPPLSRQLHREGRVELHAIIAIDGTIQSLEVISGDPMFLQSALAAVREWRYRPTILNGQPVEVDTHITVIYTLAQ